MKRIWNTFCEDISKNKGVKEMTFEKEIVKGFLQALGWSRYDRNLEEQYGLYRRKWIPDFVFYLNNDKNAKEIIFELKKPDHKQRKVDIEQIEAYMKLTDCRFGLYFGEKLEVFYLEEKDGKRSAASVTTIDWTIDNEAGASLIELLNFKNYDRKKLEQFCLDHLYLNAFLRHCNHQGGQKQLYNCIMEHFALPPSIAGNLQSRLKFTIVDNPEMEEKQIVPTSIPPTTPKVTNCTSQVTETLSKTHSHNHGIVFHRRKPRGREEVSGDRFSPSTQALFLSLLFQQWSWLHPILLPLMVSKWLPAAPGTNCILVHIQQGERRGAV